MAGHMSIMASLMELLLLLAFLRLSSGQACLTLPDKPRVTCICETEGGIVDLTSIANDNGKPK